MKNSFSYFFTFIMVLISVLFLTLPSGCKTENNYSSKETTSSFQQQQPTIVEKPLEQGVFEATILDIGKADCVILRLNGSVIMIDTGYSNNAEKIINTLKEKEIDKINHLVITHFDKDHVGGASEIIEQVTVDNVYFPNDTVNSDEYKSFTQSVTNNNISSKVMYSKDICDINFATASVKIFAPKKDEYKGENDYSLIVTVNYSSNSFLFMGDAESKRIKEFVKDNDVQYDFVKIPHHGKYDKYSDVLIENISPQFAVITADEMSDCDQKEIDVLNDFGVETYYNFNGNISVRTNGEKITIKQN